MEYGRGGSMEAWSLAMIALAARASSRQELMRSRRGLGSLAIFRCAGLESAGSAVKSRGWTFGGLIWSIWVFIKKLSESFRKLQKPLEVFREFLNFDFRISIGRAFAAEVASAR